MTRARSRFWAVAIVGFLLFAQVHVWLEAGPEQSSGHACQVCTSGGWAIVSARPGLEVTQWTLRLEVEPPLTTAKTHWTEASAPRAPPSA